ncbi:MAG TPA: ATP-binding cassette domain-containing protein, partial [Mycobacterium sp.]|nr:ATP-binding cassette domain-containing protein [Mycobacterium sp.]
MRRVDDPGAVVEGSVVPVRDRVVTYVVRDRHTSRVQALRSLTLDVRRGETRGVVGESGSGKTLGRVMLGLAPPTQGEV